MDECFDKLTGAACVKKGVPMDECFDKGTGVACVKKGVPMTSVLTNKQPKAASLIGCSAKMEIL